MKPTLINLALILAFLLSASGSLHAQYVTDTVRNQPVDTIISTSDANRQMQQMNNNAALSLGVQRLEEDGYSDKNNIHLGIDFKYQRDSIFKRK